MAVDHQHQRKRSKRSTTSTIMRFFNILSVLMLALVVWLPGPSVIAQEADPHPERLTFRGDDGQMLVGYVWKPAGDGPFPTLIWNHGSFQPGTPLGSEPKLMKRLEPLARFYSNHGYLIFFPSRHGHVESPLYTGDMLAREQELKARHDTIGLHEFWNLDVQAAIRFIRTRPDVDARRLVVTGYSYGGIQTLLTAERGMGLRGRFVLHRGPSRGTTANCGTACSER